MEVSDATFSRTRLIEILIYHQRREDSSCACGWGKRPEQVGKSWAVHIADVYEDKVLA